MVDLGKWFSEEFSIPSADSSADENDFFSDEDSVGKNDYEN